MDVALRSMTNKSCIQHKLKDVLKFFVGDEETVCLAPELTSLYKVNFVEGETWYLHTTGFPSQVCGQAKEMMHASRE